jgi:hypothetical protein
MSWFSSFNDVYDTVTQKSGAILDLYAKDLTDFATTVTSETGQIINSGFIILISC